MLTTFSAVIKQGMVAMSGLPVIRDLYNLISLKPSFSLHLKLLQLWIQESKFVFLILPKFGKLSQEPPNQVWVIPDCSSILLPTTLERNLNLLLVVKLFKETLVDPLQPPPLLCLGALEPHLPGGLRFWSS